MVVGVVARGPELPALAAEAASCSPLLGWFWLPEHRCTAHSLPSLPRFSFLPFPFSAPEEYNQKIPFQSPLPRDWQ